MNTTMSFFILITILVMAFLLSGCAPKDASKEIILKNPDEYESIFISLAGHSVDDDDDDEKNIRNEQKVKRFVEAINGLELVEPTEEELLEKRAQRNEPGNYQIGLFKPFDFEGQFNSYFLTFYSDGTIEVEQIGNHYFVKNRQPNLLNQMKTEWGIEF